MKIFKYLLIPMFLLSNIFISVYSMDSNKALNTCVNGVDSITGKACFERIHSASKKPYKKKHINCRFYENFKIYNFEHIFNYKFKY